MPSINDTVYNPFLRTVPATPTVDPVASRRAIAKTYRDAFHQLDVAYQSADVRHLFDDLTLDTMLKAVRYLEHCSELLVDISSDASYDPADHD